MKGYAKHLALTPRRYAAGAIIFILVAALVVARAGYPVAHAATWQGNQYGLPNFGGYTMPINCYSYQDYSRNYYNMTDCRASNVVAEFSVHTPGVVNGSTLWVTAPQSNSFVFSGCCGAQQSVGQPLSVPYGSTVTLEWSCLPYQSVTYSYCSFSDPYGNCYDTAEAGYTNNFFNSSNYGTLVGQTNVTVTSDSTYSLTCQGAAGSKTMSISISLTDPCPAAAWQPWNNGIYIIQPYATRKIYDSRFSSTKYCVTNTSGNYLAVPGGGGDPSGQLSAFRSYAAQVFANVFDH